MSLLRYTFRTFLTGSLLTAVLIGLYTLSICWRVGYAEQEYFGRSYLVPFALHWPQYTDPPIAASYGQKTYTFNRAGRPVVVYKQLINGFQHAYGSALAARELGPLPADLLFRANEYMEAYFEKEGRSLSHYLDTKKDLHNNGVGRAIAARAHQLDLHDHAADEYIQQSCLAAIDSGEIINSCMEPRVLQLPSLEEYGCPFLPHPKQTALAITSQFK